MPSLTIRIRTEEEAATVERLKRATHRNTSSGAMMRAAAEWPQLVDELKAARRRIVQLEAALDAVFAADREVERAAVVRIEAGIKAAKVRKSTE